jgi:hypothetical protein
VFLFSFCFFLFSLSVSSPQEYVHAKGKESNFDALKAEVQSLVERVNLSAITAARR